MSVSRIRVRVKVRVVREEAYLYVSKVNNSGRGLL
jgi:hypothetical protein